MFFVAFSGGACCFAQRIGGGGRGLEILEDLGSRVFFPSPQELGM